jgi:hypothetical protein
MPAPGRLRNDFNQAKFEIPIDHHRSPAGSCLGGFRTPDGIRKPSPMQSGGNSLTAPESGRSFRRLRAKPDKKFVDGQAAIPSSEKIPFMASRMSW